MKLKNIQRYQTALIALFLIFCAVLATCPSFLNSYFKITMDGQIHLVRFEEIARAFKSGTFPSLVNFMGFDHWGNAFTGMYPWISGLVFIIPQMIFSNPIYAIMVGYFFVNLFTLINAYLLTRELTEKLCWRLLGVVLYQYNTYHLCILYGRDALGEALAYMFLPLVFLGCFQIWKNKNMGILTLGLGMGMITNAHLITMAYSCFFLGIIEVVRFFQKKITLKEIVRFIFAAVTAGLISCFSLINVVVLMRSNKLITPGKGLLPIVPSEMFDSMLNNNISDNSPSSWNIGIILFGILLFLTFQLFTKKTGSWKLWILGSWIVFISTFSWIPYSDQIICGRFGNIQFLGRLDTWVIVFLIIGAILYLNDYDQTISKRTTFSVITIFMLMTCIFGCVKYQKIKNDNPIRYYITQKNYFDTINNNGNSHTDYGIVKKRDFVFNREFLDKVPRSFKVIETRPNSLTLAFNSDNNNKVNLPFMLYNGVNYRIEVNGKNVNNFNSDQIVKVRPAIGKNIVTISAFANTVNKFTFAISIISISVVIVLLVSGFIKNRRKSRFL